MKKVNEIVKLLSKENYNFDDITKIFRKKCQELSDIDFKNWVKEIRGKRGGARLTIYEGEKAIKFITNQYIKKGFLQNKTDHEFMKKRGEYLLSKPGLKLYRITGEYNNDQLHRITYLTQNFFKTEKGVLLKSK